MAQKICEICSKQYRTKNQNSKYCSWKCYNETRLPKERICECCGKQYPYKIRNKEGGKRFCSWECFKNFGKISIEKKCQHCGRIYKYNGKNGELFCSIKCQGLSRRLPEKDKICIICGKEYHANRADSKYCSRECKGKAKWKGDSVGYGSLHVWIRRRKPKPSVCEECKIEKSHDIHNISGEYNRDLSDWKWLCVKCHMKEDGRYERLKTGLLNIKRKNI